MMAFATLYSSNFPLFRASFRHNTMGSKLFRHLFYYTIHTVPIAKIISVKNARAWVSMVSYLKKINTLIEIL